MSVLTFLFTDIEGSTRRWEADADGMRAALAEHDDVMRETVGAHHGKLFKHAVGSRGRGRRAARLGTTGADGSCDGRGRTA
jgi:class 3 adenylate cyclase